MKQLLQKPIFFLWAMCAMLGIAIPAMGVEQSADSISRIDSTTTAKRMSLLDWPVIAVPTVSFAPETNWAFGFGGLGLFELKGAERNSDVTLSANYTLKNQYSIQAQTTLYFDEATHWMFTGNVGYRHYPNTFYGVGNKRGDLLKTPWNYSSNAFYFMGQALYKTGSGWMFGPTLQLRFEKMLPNRLTDSISALYAVKGFESFRMVGLGAVVAYDSRDYQYYPTRGLFFKAKGYYYEPWLGSSYRVGLVDVDFRQYVTLFRQFIFAWQGVAAGVLGRDLPFELMPTLGGSDVGRGLRNGMWRDQVMMQLQGEFRIPIWRFFKAAVFASVGDVYHWNRWEWTTPKVGYGVGLRLAVLKPSVYLRCDMARQNYNNGWMFYFTVKEAF